MNIDDKIHENAGKIKVLLIAVLAVLLTYRIFMLSDADSFIRVTLKSTRLGFIPFAPCFIILSEIISIFLKGRTTIFLSVTNIILSIGVVLVNGVILALCLFVFLIDGTFTGIPEVIAEIVMNIILCVGAGILLILNEKK